MQSIAITGELTIYTAATEKAHLQAFLDSDEDLEINLSQVTEMDTAGLQVLVLMKQAGLRLDKKIHYVMHSKAVIEILEMSNLTTSFGDQIVLT
ncbi:MAG: STAS domain-containing protein [Undibacterium sp.]|nr:STAS domain-containing protein [Undibacterium sp.]